MASACIIWQEPYSQTVLMAERKEEGKTYVIPPNFVDKVTVIGGMVRLRNLIEAVVVSTAVVAPPLIFIPMSFSAKLYVVILAGAPFLVLGCIGLNGDSLFQFVSYWSAFRRNKRIARYNPHIKKPDNVRETLMGDTTELPRDKIRKKVAQLTGRTFEIEDQNLDELYADVNMRVRFDDDDTVLSYGYEPDKDASKKESRKQQQKLERQLAALNASNISELHFDKYRNEIVDAPQEVEIDELAEITNFIENVKMARSSGGETTTFTEALRDIDSARLNHPSGQAGGPQKEESPVFDVVPVPRSSSEKQP